MKKFIVLLGIALFFASMPGHAARNPYQYCKKTQAPIAQKVFGIHVWGQKQTDPKTLAALDDLKIKWAYNVFYWPMLEPTKDAYNATLYDSYFLALAQRGINPVMSVANFWPTWITTQAQLKTEVYQIVKGLAHRYKPGGVFAQQYGLGNWGVQYWEIINEPNYPCCGWGPQGANYSVDTTLYTALLGESNRAIREEDTNAVILLGGLSSSNQYMSPTSFLSAVYKAGAKNCFDVVGYHPYGEHRNFAGALSRIKYVMGIYGDTNKPVWFSELGEWRLQPTGDGMDTQIQVLNYALAQINVVPAFFWLGLHDFSQSETWGLLDGNLNPRDPAYTTVKTYIQSAQ